MSKSTFPSILNPEWKYTSARDTDIRKTLAKHGFKPTKKGSKNESVPHPGRAGRKQETNP